jgi:hypothetical protein
MQFVLLYYSALLLQIGCRHDDECPKQLRNSFGRKYFRVTFLNVRFDSRSVILVQGREVPVSDACLKLVFFDGTAGNACTRSNRFD